MPFTFAARFSSSSFAGLHIWENHGESHAATSIGTAMVQNGQKTCSISYGNVVRFAHRSVVVFVVIFANVPSGFTFTEEADILPASILWGLGSWCWNIR